MDDRRARLFGVIHIGTHWNRGKDTMHINLEVPVEILHHLNGTYSAQFSASLQHCIELLRRPLFESHTVELTTDLGRGHGIRYSLIRRCETPPRGVIGELADEFEQFVRSLATAIPLRLAERHEGEYSSTSRAVYTRHNNDDHAFIKLEHEVPPGDYTKVDFDPQTYEVNIQQSGGKKFITLRGNDSTFLPKGEFGGDMTMADIKEEVRCLLRDAVFKLPLPD